MYHDMLHGSSSTWYCLDACAPQPYKACMTATQVIVLHKQVHIIKPGHAAAEPDLVLQQKGHAQASAAMQSLLRAWSRPD